jgi:hypothetical protein
MKLAVTLLSRVRGYAWRIITSSGSDDWIYWCFYTVTLSYNQYSAIADLHTLQFTVAHALGFSVSTSHILATDLNTGTITSNHYENTCYVLSRIRVYWFATGHGADHIEDSYCCHARLSGRVFTACCIATRTARTHSEHCFHCCVFIGTCLRSRCLAMRHNTFLVGFDVLTAVAMFCRLFMQFIHQFIEYNFNFEFILYKRIISRHTRLNCWHLKEVGNCTRIA